MMVGLHLWENTRHRSQEYLDFQKFSINDDMCNDAWDKQFDID